MTDFLSRCFIFIALVRHSYESQYLSIKCGRKKSWETLQKENFTGDTLSISGCSLPEYSYAETLREFGVNSTKLRELYLSDLPPELPLRNEHFAGLNLADLRITTPHITFKHSNNREPPGAVDLSNGEDIEIRCDNKVLRLSQLAPALANLTIHLKKITIINCEAPPETYAQALWALNINPVGVTELDLRVRIHEEVPASSFQNLTIQTLSMIWPDPYLPLMDINRQVVDVDIFTVAPTIENFLLYGAILPMLPTSRLKKVSLTKGASVEKWGDCEELKHLELSEWEVPAIPKWVAECSQLTTLELGQLKAASVTNVLTRIVTLTELRINSCELGFLTETLLADAKFLLKLDLSENSLRQIHRNAFISLTKLQELSMPDNKLWDARELIFALQPLKQLRKLDLDRNVLLSFCVDPYINPMPVQELTLRYTSLSRLCFGKWSNLTTLSAFKTKVTSIQLDGTMLPRPMDHDLHVDLRSCPLSEWPKTSSWSDMMIEPYKKAKNITVLVSLILDCNCEGGWFARTLRSLPNLEIKGAVCTDEEPLQSSRPDHIQRLECDKSSCEGCVCRRSWRDNSTEMDCIATSLRAVPNLQNIPNLRSLRATKNYIDALPDLFPDALMKVDVSDNDISRLRPEALAALFSTRARSVALAQNPIICDCENEPMIAALHNHREQVIDFDNVTCAGDAINVRDLDLDALCVAERERQMLAGAAAGGTLLAVAAIAAILCYRYWKEIKVFLYSRGWCLGFVKEHELDGQRPYDAFISFAHGDEQLVAEELLPILEKEYTLCVHTRDWLPGELITTQVFQSVERSRRTVIVLSRNFVRSVWGMMEFRTAHTSALSEGRVRVIVVLLDDVIEDEGLHDDLRWYLRTNTYLKWGDPWFWDKMRYAMPHRSSPPPANSQPPMPYDNLRFPQNEMPAIRNDLENQQPIINDPPTIENGPDSL